MMGVVEVLGKQEICLSEPNFEQVLSMFKNQIRY